MFYLWYKNLSIKQKGDGTRGGTGKCICDTGYGSELCDQCKTGHFEEMKNETYIKCTGNKKKVKESIINLFIYLFLFVILRMS